MEVDLLNTNKFAMMGLAKLAAAMFGTTTVANGLACVPTVPATLTVNVNPGEIYSLVNVDGTAYSSVSADTTHQVMKQGILMDALNLSCPAPATAGQSINYLIQAIYQDSDTDLTALPYYNSANPTQAWSGPGNSGTAQATTRKGVITLSAKAGVSATTGSQVTPAADSGYTGLWVVTVANGQTQITAGNISQATNAPILPADLLHAIQQSSLTVAVDTGVANAYAVNYSPPITSLTDGMVLWFKAKTANTGASTLNVNGLGTVPLVGGAHVALQGSEIAANGKCQVVYKADINSFVLIDCTGGAIQVPGGTKSNQAINLGQFGASLSGNGYQQLPNGLIIQWGSVVSTIGTTPVTLAVTFPIAFTSSAFAMLAGLAGDINVSAGPITSVGAAPLSTAQGNVYAVRSSGSVSETFYWFAIGK